MNIKEYFKNRPFVFMIVYAIVYFVWFYALEGVVDPETANVIHCKLDDYIPFCEYFVIPYFLWFLFIPFVLILLMKKDRDSFWKMVVMMFGGNLLCLAIYTVFPNTVPEKFIVEGDNIFCHIVNIMYSADTPTNVCPSIHVLDTLGAHIALCKSNIIKNKPGLKLASAVFLVLVCMATVTLKQHSIIDVFASFVTITPLAYIAYRKKKKTITV